MGTSPGPNTGFFSVCPCTPQQHRTLTREREKMRGAEPLRAAQRQEQQARAAPQHRGSSQRADGNELEPLTAGAAAGHARAAAMGQLVCPSMATLGWRSGTAPAGSGEGRISASPEDSQWPGNMRAGFGAPQLGGVCTNIPGDMGETQSLESIITRHYKEIPQSPRSSLLRLPVGLCQLRAQVIPGWDQPSRCVLFLLQASLTPQLPRQRQA